MILRTTLIQSIHNGDKIEIVLIRLYRNDINNNETISVQVDSICKTKKVIYLASTGDRTQHLTLTKRML